MPQATPVFARPACNVPPLCRPDSLPLPDGVGSYQDAILVEACNAALAVQRAMLALMDSTWDAAPSDPARLATDAAISRLQPQWRSEVECALSIPSVGMFGLQTKAALLAALIELDDQGRADTPALGLAASLAADVAQYRFG